MPLIFVFLNNISHIPAKEIEYRIFCGILEMDVFQSILSIFIIIQLAQLTNCKPLRSSGSDWLSWSAWSACTSSHQFRVRSCTTNRGYTCTGSDHEMRLCDVADITFDASDYYDHSVGAPEASLQRNNLLFGTQDENGKVGMHPTDRPPTGYQILTPKSGQVKTRKASKPTWITGPLISNHWVEDTNYNPESRRVDFDTSSNDIDYGYAAYSEENVAQVLDLPAGDDQWHLFAGSKINHLQEAVQDYVFIPDEIASRIPVEALPPHNPIEIKKKLKLSNDTNNLRLKDSNSIETMRENTVDFRKQRSIFDINETPRKNLLNDTEYKSTSVDLGYSEDASNGQYYEMKPTKIENNTKELNKPYPIETDLTDDNSPKDKAKPFEHIKHIVQPSAPYQAGENLSNSDIEKSYPQPQQTDDNKNLRINKDSMEDRDKNIDEASQELNEEYLATTVEHEIVPGIPPNAAATAPIAVTTKPRDNQISADGVASSNLRSRNPSQSLEYDYESEFRNPSQVSSRLIGNEIPTFAGRSVFVPRSYQSYDPWHQDRKMAMKQLGHDVQVSHAAYNQYSNEQPTSNYIPNIPAGNLYSNHQRYAVHYPAFNRNTRISEASNIFPTNYYPPIHQTINGLPTYYPKAFVSSETVNYDYAEYDDSTSTTLYAPLDPWKDDRNIAMQQLGLHQGHVNERHRLHK